MPKKFFFQFLPIVFANLLPSIENKEEIYKLYATHSLQENAELNVFSLEYLFLNCEEFREAILDFYSFKKEKNNIAPYTEADWQKLLVEIGKKISLANQQTCIKEYSMNFVRANLEKLL